MVYECMGLCVQKKKRVTFGDNEERKILNTRPFIGMLWDFDVGRIVECDCGRKDYASEMKRVGKGKEMQLLCKKCMKRFQGN